VPESYHQTATEELTVPVSISLLAYGRFVWWFFLLAFSIVVEYSCGSAYRAESIIAEDITAETMIRFQW